MGENEEEFFPLNYIVKLNAEFGNKRAHFLISRVLYLTIYWYKIYEHMTLKIQIVD